MFMPQERADSLIKFISYRLLLSSTGVFPPKKRKEKNPEQTKSCIFPTRVLVVLSASSVFSPLLSCQRL